MHEELINSLISSLCDVFSLPKKAHYSITDYFFSCSMSLTLLEEEFFAGVISSRLIGWIGLSVEAILAGVVSARGATSAGVSWLSESQFLPTSTLFSLLTGVCI